MHRMFGASAALRMFGASAALIVAAGIGSVSSAAAQDQNDIEVVAPEPTSARPPRRRVPPRPTPPPVRPRPEQPSRPIGTSGGWEVIEPPDAPSRRWSNDEFGIRAHAELGFLGVLDHDIRLGSDGTDIDYRVDGGQGNLFFFARLAVEFDIWREHFITFLYQPLELASEATLRRDLRIDGLDYAAGTPVRFFYGFPFFRVSWDYNVLQGPDELLAFGLGLQLRNAEISFESLDGELYRTRNDVGPVPLLRARGRFPIDRFFAAFEVDGFYAPISILNGSDTEVTGAILDASLRFGWQVADHADVFLNLRYLAGGAVGESDPTPTSDGRQENWLHFMTLSLGATIDSRP